MREKRNEEQKAGRGEVAGKEMSRSKRSRRIWRRRRRWGRRRRRRGSRGGRRLEAGGEWATWKK
jgi:hypothetical protein